MKEYITIKTIIMISNNRRQDSKLIIQSGSLWFTTTQTNNKSFKTQ